MTVREPRILFISHDAYRGGATILLLNMLKWLADHTKLRFSVAIREEGEMVDVFRTLCDTYILRDLYGPIPEIPKFPSRAWFRQKRMPPKANRPDIQSLIDSGMFDVLYFNTITLGDHLGALNLRGLPVITHVHELSMTIRSCAREQEGVAIGRSDRLICVSDAVANNLTQNLSCPPDKIRRIYGFVPVDKRPSASRHELQKRLLHPLGLPQDALVVGMCGSGRIHKGIDLVIPLARLIPAEVGGKPVHFIWLGAQTSEYPAEVGLEDALRAGLAARIHFAGVSMQPADWISLFDVHALMSREDSFPLVVMEAAAHGVPTVCFEGAGGAPEFVRDDAGVVVPYLDLANMARALMELLGNEALRDRLGRTARHRVQTAHAPSITLPEIYLCIKEVFENSSASKQGSAD